MRHIIASWPRHIKLITMLLMDICIIVLSLWLSISLRYGIWWQPSTIEHIIVFIVAIVSSISMFSVLGVYRWMVRYISRDTVLTVVKGVCVSGLLLATAILFSQAELPRSTPIIYVMVASIGILSSRFLAQNYLLSATKSTQGIPVIIYGAGQTGSQLALSLLQNHEFVPVAFVDDAKKLQNMLIYGLKVYPASSLSWLIDNYDAQQILLAIPSLSKSRRREVLLFLERFEIKISTVPAMADILSGKSRLDEIREVELEDLLGRDVVPPKLDLMSAKIMHKNILVTGAGGSIGSELCRQIIALKPSVLVLFEQNEYGLYKIDQELQSVNSQIKIIPILGTIQSQQCIEKIFEQYQINTVFHAAAYKHVPLVEANVVEGIKNNVFGTLSVAQAAISAKVSTFVLISTDKAVRPTNVMGATKRLAELILQAFAQEQTDTCFCMVRFGNVLGSSGSVVPLFKTQIRAGGPVTVTHPDIIRYFMTIPEAAQLVIQASAMAKGGDVFLLDMGEPVRIADLAKRMIHLMGYHVKSDEYPEGIDIKYSGLRAGEKLFEELLVGDNDESTEHPRVRKALEHSIAKSELNSLLDELNALCVQENTMAIYEFFSHLGIGFSYRVK